VAQVSGRLLAAIGALSPLLFVLLAIAVSGLGADPKIAPEEEERLVREIEGSEWARRLAAAMTTTPEAQRYVTRLLARSVVETMKKML
jgi:hypothetical protein